jgi:hypothetical protein
VLLFQLEIRNPIAQQAADLVIPLVNRNGVSSAGQLLRSGESQNLGQMHHQ